MSLIKNTACTPWFIRDTVKFGLEPSLKCFRIQSSIVPYFVPYIFNKYQYCSLYPIIHYNCCQRAKLLHWKPKKRKNTPAGTNKDLSKCPANLSCYLIDTVQKLGFWKLDCPLAVSEPIVSISMCPLDCLGNSTMSLIEVSLINHTACTISSLHAQPAVRKLRLELRVSQWDHGPPQAHHQAHHEVIFDVKSNVNSNIISIYLNYFP